MAGLDALIPELRPYAHQLVDLAASAGLQPRVTSTLRSRAQQERLYRRYQSGISTLPAAPPGTSSHEYGWAFDLVVTPYEALADLGAIWEHSGLVWGRERDPVHFEYPGFKTARAVEKNPVVTLAEWFNDLPWYVQIALPLPTMMAENKPVPRWLLDWVHENFGL